MGPPNAKASVIFTLLCVLYVAVILALSAVLDSVASTLLVVFPLLLLPAYALLISSYRKTGARNLSAWIGLSFITSVWFVFVVLFLLAQR